MRYRIGLCDDAMRGAIAEGVADRYAVRMKTIRADLRLADHATTQIVQVTALMRVSPDRNTFLKLFSSNFKRVPKTGRSERLVRWASTKEAAN